MFSRAFVYDAGERALKTFAQALIAVLAAGTTLWDVPWVEGVGVAGLAALISVLTSIADPGVQGDEYTGRHRAEDAPLVDSDGV